MPIINLPSIHHQPGACWPRMIMVFRYGLQTRDHFHRPRVDWPLGPIGCGRSAGIVFWCRSTWSFPDGGRKKVDWGYIWMLQGDVQSTPKGGVHWRFFQHCNLQNIRCKQSSCPTAAEPVEAEWSSPTGRGVRPVRTCSWTEVFRHLM